MSGKASITSDTVYMTFLPLSLILLLDFHTHMTVFSTVRSTQSTTFMYKNFHHLLLIILLSLNKARLIPSMYNQGIKINNDKSRHRK